MKNVFSKIILFVLIFVFFGFFIFRNIAEITKTVNLTTSSLTVWLFLAMIASFLAYIFVIKTHQKAFEMVNVKINFKRIAKLNLSSLATNVLIPSGGVSGGLIFVEDSKDHDYGSGAAVAGHILYIVSEYTSIALLLAVSLAYLAFTRQMMASVTIPVVIFLAIAVGFYALLYLAFKKSKSAEKIVAILVTPVLAVMRWFTKNRSNPSDAAGEFLTEMNMAANVIKKSPRKLLESVGWAFGNHFFKLTAMFLIFYSLGYMIKPSVLLAGYIIGIVVMIVSPTPNGIGFVEGSMVLVFAHLKVPREIATTVTLIFRGFAFWLPFFIGLFLLQKTRIAKIKNDLAGSAGEVKK